jgi:hypothetical protein
MLIKANTEKQTAEAMTRGEYETLRNVRLSMIKVKIFSRLNNTLLRTVCLYNAN